MNTPTHLLLSAAILARDDKRPAPPGRNWAVIVGALIPDAAIFVMFAWTRLIQGASEREVWSTLYWQEPWQSLVAVANSVPLFAALALAGLAARSPLILLIALSALIHLAFDLPFHHDDAHPHFWPFTDWRFHSPLSYWDPRHHGSIVSIAEAVLAVGLIVLLWRRFQGRLVRAALALGLASYVAVPVYFSLALG